MFRQVISRMQGKPRGSFDFDVEGLNTIDLVSRWRLVNLLKKMAIEEGLKITYTDYDGTHYHLEWEPSDIPSMEFRWPQSN